MSINKTIYGKGSRQKRVEGIRGAVRTVLYNLGYGDSTTLRNVRTLMHEGFIPIDSVRQAVYQVCREEGIVVDTYTEVDDSAFGGRVLVIKRPALTPQNGDGPEYRSASAYARKVLNDLKDGETAKEVHYYDPKGRFKSATKLRSIFVTQAHALKIPITTRITRSGTLYITRIPADILEKLEGARSAQSEFRRSVKASEDAE